jgi:hypothetical protein
MPRELPVTKATLPVKSSQLDMRLLLRGFAHSYPLSRYPGEGFLRV